MLRVDDPFKGWQAPTAAELRRIAREESEAALEELAAATRQQAAFTPGWERYSEKLGVFADEGEVYMGLQPGDEDEEAAFDMEYGTSKQGPTGLLRTTMLRHGPRLGRQLGHRVTQRIINPTSGPS